MAMRVRLQLLRSDGSEVGGAEQVLADAADPLADMEPHRLQKLLKEACMEGAAKLVVDALWKPEGL